MPPELGYLARPMIKWLYYTVRQFLQPHLSFTCRSSSLQKIIFIRSIMSTPSIRSTLPAAFILSIIGWGGLSYLFINTLPTLWPRWFFFFLSVWAITGAVLPFIALLNLRFPTVPPAGRDVIVREALLVGGYAATLAWLQLGRVLTFGVAMLLFTGLTLIELLLRLRERSRWLPDQTHSSDL